MVSEHVSGDVEDIVEEKKEEKNIEEKEKKSDEEDENSAEMRKKGKLIVAEDRKMGRYRVKYK